MDQLTVPGTDVMAPWMNDGFLYAAVVIRLDPDDPFKVLVAFWEGASATVKVESLRPCVYEPGMKVYANYANQNDYQPGRIVERLGGAVSVELENGMTVWTTWPNCRVKKKKKL